MILQDSSSLFRIFLQTDRSGSLGELNYSASAGASGGEYVEQLLLSLLEQEEINLCLTVSANSSQVETVSFLPVVVLALHHCY